MFMCHCFVAVYPGFWNGEGNLTWEIHKLIPEFNREILGATTSKGMSA